MSDLFKKQRTLLTFFNRRLDEFTELEKRLVRDERLYSKSNHENRKRNRGI